MSASKRRRTRSARHRSPRGPDDVVELPFGYMARFGRMITMRNTIGPEEHGMMVEAFLAGADDLRRKQEERRIHLLEILAEVDPVDLLARASLTYLHIDPDTFKEWESDRSPAHVEYLALQILGFGVPARRDCDPRVASHLTGEAMEIVREMFRDAQMLIIMGGIRARCDHPDDLTVEHALKTRLEALSVRGAGYVEHLIRVIHGCLDPFEDECRTALGFTAAQALALTYGIADIISDRAAPLWQEAAAARTQMLVDLKRARRRSTASTAFPDWLLKLSPTEAKVHVGMLLTTWMFRDSRGLATVTPADLAGACSLPEDTCRSFLDAFACPPELFKPEFHAFPGGAHPLTHQPILRVPEGYLLPVASSMIDAIRPRMEDLLQRDTTLWDRYVAARGRFLEKEATSLVRQVLPGSQSWQGIGWRSTADAGSDLDGLVAGDDLGVRLQCKAGRLSAPARRGAPDRMKRDIGDLITHAAKQHQELVAALAAEGPGALGFSDDQSSALLAPLQLEMIVCLDDVTVWATEAHELRKMDALPESANVPWVLSLTDLMVIADLLNGAEFVHYALRRQRLERDGRIGAHDELDWVGHYLSEGLFFDPFFEGDDSPIVFRLLSYTEPIDAWYFTRDGARTVEAPKPAQPIPEHLALLMKRLEEERPQHWLLASVALLDGDQQSRDVWDGAIAHARVRVPQEGWSNASQTFRGRLGITFFVDLRTPWPSIRDQVDDYCRTKAEEHDQSNWIGIGEGGSGSLFVVMVERDPALPLARLFVDPPGDAAPEMAEAS